MIFDFFYYCLYRMFALFKRVGEKDESLAALFYSILISTHVATLSILLKFFIRPGFFAQVLNDVLLKAILVLIFFISYSLCRYYFIKKEKYKEITKYYERRFDGNNNKMALIGVVYSLFTFGSFIIIALWLSRK
jgi:hypothetical protein